MERARPGVREINPCLSNVMIMLWTEGGVTPKYSWRFASDGGLRCSLVYVAINAKY
jgi:hypothetical protein